MAWSSRYAAVVATALSLAGDFLPDTEVIRSVLGFYGFHGFLLDLFWWRL